MELQTLWLDRAEIQDKLGQDGPSGRYHLAAISRSASLGVADNQPSFWLVLRGDAQLSCREGTFALQAGDWIAVDRDSRPTLLSGRRTLAIALVMPSGHAFEQSDLPHPPRARACRRACRAHGAEVVAQHRLLRAGQPHGERGHGCGRAQDPAFPVLAAGRPAPHGRSLPGRSLRRKRQVFARMQRARLYLDGNAGHQVRLAELAGLCNFSVWYFTKTFHALYEEGPRQTMSHVRLQQASELLERTSLSVGEVGAACGFESPCSFARAFRAHYGTTASDYRSVRRAGKTPERAKRSSA